MSSLLLYLHRCEKMEIEVTENVKSFVSEVKEESGKYVDLQNILLVRHAPRTQWCNLTPSKKVAGPKEPTQPHGTEPEATMLTRVSTRGRPSPSDLI